MNSQFIDAYIGKGREYFHYLLGVALYNSERTEEAMFDYRGAIDLNRIHL